MKFKFFHLITIFAICISNSAHSQIVETSESAKFRFCNTCVTDQDFANTALIESSSSVNNVTKVLNVRTGEIKTYSVSIEKEPGFNINKFVDEMPTSTQDILNAQQLKQDSDIFYNRFSDYNVPSSVIPSGIDLIGNSYNLTKLTDYMNKTESTDQYIARYISSLTYAAGLIQVGLTLEVRFSNNSRATLKISSLGRNGEFKVELTEVLDSNGNLIPLTAASANERSTDVYTFLNEDSYQEFLRLLWRYGVKTVNISGGSIIPAGRVNIVDCGTARECFTKRR